MAAARTASGFSQTGLAPALIFLPRCDEPMNIAKLAVWFVLSLACGVTHASLLFYELRFEVEEGTVFSDSGYDPQAVPPYTVTERDAAGNVYRGAFAIDSEILSTDGIGRTGELAFFVIKMEDNVWGYNFPFDNSFRGFRGPTPSCPTFGCFAPSPGFDVVDGEITNLRGGVYGSGDIPFVDFGLLGENTFIAHGTSISAYHPDSWLVGSGRMDIFRVSEPSSLALFSVVLLGFGLTRARCARRGEGLKE